LPVISGLVDHALLRGVHVDFQPVFEACEGLRMPNLTRTMQYLNEQQGDRPRPNVNESGLGELGRRFYEARQAGESANFWGTGNSRRNDRIARCPAHGSRHRSRGTEPAISSSASYQ
jgi:hypothetical protein